jgi:RimJ/RimL family protein N-acetyltransferase
MDILTQSLPIELTTDRTLIRTLRLDDIPHIHEYAKLPEACEYQGWGPNTEEDTRQFVEKHIAAPYFFSIELKDTKQLIGGCNLSVTNKELREAMIGYTLNPKYWNKGYMTEVARKLLEFGFGTLQLHRIQSHATPENVGSWRVMEKLGMRREGHEVEAAYFKGKWHDWFRYAILDREWKH